MKKAIITIQEELKFRREIKVKLPEGMTEEKFNEIMDCMEREDNLDDALYILKKSGIEVEFGYNQDYDSPDNSEIEIWDYDIEEVNHERN